MKTYKLTHTYHLHQPLNKTVTQPKPKSRTSFNQHLQQAVQLQELKFSEHARLRLQERGIELTSELVERLHTGLKKAQSKGARESLMLTEDTGFCRQCKEQDGNHCNDKRNVGRASDYEH